MSLIAALVLGATPVAITVTPGKQVPSLRPIAMVASPTGSQFAVSLEDGTVRIINASNGQTVRQLGKHPQPAYAIDWSADGRFIATGDESARVWIENALTGEKVREFRTHTRGIQKLSFNRTRTALITTGRDDQIHLLDLVGNSPKEKKAILGKGANFYGATFDPFLPDTFTTAVLATGGGRKYDEKGDVKGFVTGHDGQGALDVAYSPAGTRLVTGGKDGTAVVTEPKTMKRLAVLRGHEDWVMSVCFSPNGKLIATSSTDRKVRVWDSTSYKKVAEIDNQSFVGSPLAFTADGKTLLTVSDQGFLQYNSVSPAQAAVQPPAKAPIRPGAKKTTRSKK